MKDDESEEVREALENVMVPHGKESGEKIAEVLRDRGHDRVIPLYRSAVNIKIEKAEMGVPYIVIESYGDPHFWGAEEITEESVTDDPHEYRISGGRTGALQIQHEGEKMKTRDLFELEK